MRKYRQQSVNKWLTVADSSMFDKDAIAHAFAQHMRRLEIPQQECIFHPSPQEALPALRKYYAESPDAYAIEWWKMANCSDDKEWDEVQEFLSNQLRSTEWFDAIVAVQREYKELRRGVFSLFWTATSEAIWTHRWRWLARFYFLNPWILLREAFASGALLFWLHRGVHVILRPRMWRDPEGELHREDGPAMAWEDGTGLYFWHGVRVSRQAIMNPETLLAQEILAEPNVATRAALIERYGEKRLLREKGEIIHVSQEGILYQLKLPGEWESRLVLEVTCPSTGEKAWLRVPPEMRQVHQAIAWTFGLQSHQYRPSTET
jgi:hypothetical protein